MNFIFEYSIIHLKTCVRGYAHNEGFPRVEVDDSYIAISILA